MKKICVEYIIPGMMLAKSVNGLDGSVLLEKGKILEENDIELLNDAGIDYVFVTVQDKEDEEKFLLNLAEDYVCKFFMYVNPDSKIFSELFEIVIELVYEGLKKGMELPCEKFLRAKHVERMKDLFLKDMGGPEDIIKHELSLASFPNVYFRLKKLLDSGTASAKDIAEVVSSDVALATKLLKLVNSPLFALTQKVTSIEQAVALVGEEELTAVALGLSAIRYFKDIPPELMDMKTFWKHSLSCGIFAKIIASHVKGMSEETLFTAGLLHDVGKLILFKNMPYSTVESLIFARENMVPMVEAEEIVLGYTHTDVSSLIMKSWEFPDEINDIVTYHHSPDGASFKKGAIIVQLADNMANAVEIARGGSYVVPGMSDEDFDELNLPIKALRPIVEKHNELLDTILATIL